MSVKVRSFSVPSFVPIECHTFALPEMSKMLRWTSQKSALHHDPNCAVRLFVPLLASIHFQYQDSRRTQTSSFVHVFSMGVGPCRVVGGEPNLRTSALR